MPAISEFIETELNRLESEKPAYSVKGASSDRLNEVFRNALTEIWK
jgi:hypothetical protein